MKRACAGESFSLSGQQPAFSISVCVLVLETADSADSSGTDSLLDLKTFLERPFVSGSGVLAGVGGGEPSAD